MDFVSGLPRTQKGNDVVWVVVDRLTKSTHFLAMCMGDSVNYLAELYVREIVRLHGVLMSIVSNKDTRFKTRLWQSLQTIMETQLTISTAYHPQTDSQSKLKIQILEDMLRACVLDFKGSWKKYLSLAEFAYNNCFQASVGMAHFEALYSM